VKLAQSLRDQGIWTVTDLKVRNLSKQLEYANSALIPYVVVLGPQELKSQMLKIKNMATRAEFEVPLKDLANKLQSLS
jgi:histidyl-tRNA synthetase